MKKIEFCVVKTEGDDRIGTCNENGYFIKMDKRRYEDHKKAISELEEAWAKRSQELIKQGYEVINEWNCDPHPCLYGFPFYSKQIVLKDERGYAKIISMRVEKSSIILR